MELSEWHFPHILHTSRALVRSSNFEELSSRPLGRGVVKQNLRQRSPRTPADSSKTNTSNISSCRTGRHARQQAHRRTQTHALTQTHKTTLDGTRTRTCTRRRPATVPFFHVTVTAKRRHAHSNTQLKNCFLVRCSSVNHAHFGSAARQRPGGRL